ncbi:MAG: porphobilinogen synthase [Candidatus Bipolaricaulia bacterium]
MRFPDYRPRRIRRTEQIRRLVREHRILIDDLIQPIFAVDGKGINDEIPSMPKVFHRSVDQLHQEMDEILTLGIPGVLVFGVPDPEKKDERGSEAYHEGGIAQRAIQAIRRASEALVIISDVCLCSYTDHGHCGIVREAEIQNDETLKLLGKIAVSHAESGADWVAPSGMIDGMVGAIREALDRAGRSDVAIMSYAAKYSSGFYGPFRDAAYSAPQFGDRRSYQMDPANAREAMREVALDIEEGADIVMVKPALAYLDIIRRVRERFDHPIAAYSVSGEYSMIKAAAERGWVDEQQIVLEILTGLKRAGADILITYFAKEVARWLSD